MRRIAVLGIKTETQRGQPAIEVPRYLERVGFDVVPVPVYYPEVESILRRPVFRRLVDVPGGIDLVNVFRKSKDLAAHLDDILAKRLRELESENNRLKKLLAEAVLDNEALKVAFGVKR